ncbi:MAG: glycosyltransferase family 2 protein [Rhodocyclaceae bacterium]|nr:glycosyltransferase family 2 protein [Rhodocyclaceae bacterium]
MADDRPSAVPLLSVVVPVYNEEAVLPEFHARLGAVLDRLPLRSEVLYVNDGSGDRTQALVDRLCQADARVASVELSRNFGKEIAMTCGLDHAQGDVVVIIDADLQDPPELIARLVQEWQAGFDVVYARRTERRGETWLKRATAAMFYRVIQRVSQVNIPRNTGDFRLMSRRAVAALLQLREKHRFMKGLFAWVGFPQQAVDYCREPRFAGKSKFNFWRLWNFALEGLTSFTIGPLKIATYVGLLTAMLAFCYGAVIIARTLLYGDPVRGYPTVMVTILFLGGIQLMFIGVIGEYLGRTYDETKHRPLYLVQGYRPAKESGDTRAPRSTAAHIGERRRARGGNGTAAPPSRGPG